MTNILTKTTLTWFPFVTSPARNISATATPLGSSYDWVL
jgi:hypothetical protein